MKKYEMTNEVMEYSGRTLYRIKRLSDGELGGWIEVENNLSQNGYCWIKDEAIVYGNAIICDNAMVYDNARIFGNAKVCDNAIVYGNARIYGNAKVCDNAIVYGNAMVYDNARIYGNAKVCDNAIVCGNARIYGNAKVCDNAIVYGDAIICDNAMVYGDVEVYGNARIRGNSLINELADFIVFKNWWSSGRYFTWTRSNNLYSVGCFLDTGEELIKKAYKDSDNSGDNYKAIVDYINNVVLKQNLI